MVMNMEIKQIYENRCEGKTTKENHVQFVEKIKKKFRKIKKTIKKSRKKTKIKKNLVRLFSKWFTPRTVVVYKTVKAISNTKLDPFNM